MDITVVGSHTQDNERLEGEFEHFQEACRQIGKGIASWGHRLVVPHTTDDRKNIAEVFALEGFREVNQDHYYECVVHQGDPTLKAHFDAVEKSDAVILIGGMNGTYAAGLSALRGRKMILPIRAFGGSAKDLCEIPEIDRMLDDKLRNIKIPDENWEEKLYESIKTVLDGFPRLLIIHGRGDDGTTTRAAEANAGQGCCGEAPPVPQEAEGAAPNTGGPGGPDAQGPQRDSAS